MIPDLFSALQLGPYDLKNRFVMAPMTRNRAEPDFDFRVMREL